MKLGRLDEVVKRLRAINAVLPLMTEHDDVAATHARLAVATRALGRDDQADAHLAQAAAALEKHRAEQARWAEALASVDFS